MLNIKIVCVGKLKEKYWRDACAEYVKRLGAYCNVEITELKEEKLPSGASPADEQKVIDAEGMEILRRIDGSAGIGKTKTGKTATASGGRRDYVVALDIKGTEMSSEELAGMIDRVSMDHSTVVFVIGGSLGLSDDVKKRADAKMSFGRITLPHQLARVVNLEQIYRAFKINAGEIYHK